MKAASLEHYFDPKLDFVDVEGFREEVLGPAGQAGLLRLRGGVGGKDEDG